MWSRPIFSFGSQGHHVASNFHHVLDYIIAGCPRSHCWYFICLLVGALVCNGSYAYVTIDQMIQYMWNRNQNYIFPGCIKEGNIDYTGNDIARIRLGTQQACAEYSVSIDGGLFWTYTFDSNYCHVKSSNAGRSRLDRAVSGNRACGLENQLTPLGVAVSQQQSAYPTDRCADSDPLNFCVVAKAPFPWLALYFHSKARVGRVEIWNRRDCCGDRLRNFEVRVTDSLPSSGIPSLLLNSWAKYLHLSL